MSNKKLDIEKLREEFSNDYRKIENDYSYYDVIKVIYSKHYSISENITTKLRKAGFEFATHNKAHNKDEDKDIYLFKYDLDEINEKFISENPRVKAKEILKENSYIHEVTIYENKSEEDNNFLEVNFCSEMWEGEGSIGIGKETIEKLKKSGLQITRIAPRDAHSLYLQVEER